MVSTPTLQVPVMFDSPHEAVDPFDQDWTQVPGRTKSDGTPLTLQDIEANDMADGLAKRGVEDHRVPYRVRQEWERCMKTTTARAQWIARATREANNLPQFPFSDSESSRRAADEAKKKKLEAKSMGGEKSKLVPKVAAFARSPALGGHTLEDHAVQRRVPLRPGVGKSVPVKSVTVKAWSCTMCRLTSTKWHSFAPARCTGSAASRWANKAVIAADNA